MDLKYKPVLGCLMVIVGLAILVLAAAAGRPIGLGSGLVLTVLGVLMLTKSPIGLSPQSITMRNLYGTEMKRHDLTGNNFEVRDNKVFIDGKRLASLWMFDTDEQTVRDYLQGAS